MELENGAARGSVAFAEQILGRIPALVLRQKTADESLKGVGVLVRAQKRFFFVLTHDAAETGAGSVDEHQVACVEQAVGVVDDFVGRRGIMERVGSRYAARSEGSHVQPHGG